MTHNPNQPSTSDEITIVDFIVILARRTKLLVVVFLVCIACGGYLVVRGGEEIKLWGSYLMPSTSTSRESIDVSAQLILSEEIVSLTDDPYEQSMLYESINFTGGNEFSVSGSAFTEGDAANVKILMDALLSSIQEMTGDRYGEMKMQLERDLELVNNQTELLTQSNELLQSPAAQSSLTSLTNQKLSLEMNLANMRPGEMLQSPTRVIHRKENNFLLQMVVNFFVSLFIAVVVTYMVDVFARAKIQLQMEQS